MDGIVGKDPGRVPDAAGRARALARYDVLGSAPEPGFDDLAKLAAHVAGTRVGLVTLIDDGRQWFKAKWGDVRVGETDLENCVCLQALQATGSACIGDLSADARTSGMWFVKRGPRARFYAGAAIRDAEGRMIGSVCTLDTGARDGAPDGVLDILETLGRQASTLLEMRVMAKRQERRSALSAERGRRNAALLRLGDALRDGEAADAIVAASVATLAEGLRHRRTGYTSIDPADAFCTVECEVADGVEGVKGTYRAREWTELLEAVADGEPLHVADVATHPATRGKAGFWRSAGVSSASFCAMRAEGRPIGHYYLHDAPAGADPADDLAFLRDVAARTQIALAKGEALRLERLNAGELNHRLKNVFSLVGAICDQTLRATATPPDVRRALRERIVALSLAQDVLTRSGTDHVGLAEIVDAALGPFGRSRVAVSGPDVVVGPRTATSFSMALHELATNASKYGALACAEGRVEASWALSGDEGGAELEFWWREHNGPRVEPPERRGFGAKVLETSFGHGFRIGRTFEPAGAAFRLLARADALRH